MPQKTPIAAAVSQAVAPPVNAFELLDSALKSYCSRLDPVAQQPTYLALHRALSTIAADLEASRKSTKEAQAEVVELKAQLATAKPKRRG